MSLIERNKNQNGNFFLMVRFSLSKDESIMNTEKWQVLLWRLKREHRVSGKRGLILSNGSIMITN